MDLDLYTKITDVDDLVINRLTKKQYDNLSANNQLSVDQIYLITDSASTEMVDELNIKIAELEHQLQLQNSLINSAYNWEELQISSFIKDADTNSYEYIIEQKCLFAAIIQGTYHIDASPYIYIQMPNSTINANVGIPTVGFPQYNEQSNKVCTLPYTILPAGTKVIFTQTEDTETVEAAITLKYILINDINSTTIKEAATALVDVDNLIKTLDNVYDNKE